MSPFVRRTALCWSNEETAEGAAALAGPGGLSEEEFQNKLLRLKADLQGGAAPATLEDLLKEAPSPSSNGEPASVQVEELRRENERLRMNLEQLRNRAAQFEREGELWRAREKEYEMMLEEKSELIRQLHQEARVQQPVAKSTDGPSEDELVALHQELQRERAMLEEDRLALEEQFRQSEIQMSKERAEIAKLRADVNRMQNEVKRQMEILEREAKVRGEMSNFMRLREELQTNANRTPGGRPTPTPGSSPTPIPDLPAMDRRAPEGGQKSRASFFGGLFRRGEE